MGLTSSIEEVQDSEIKMETGDGYESWDDIVRDLPDDEIERATTPTSTTSEDCEPSKQDDTNSEELKEVVGEFVDGVIQKAVDDYNKICEDFQDNFLKAKIREEMFAKIPSTDELYERSLEAHLEGDYEYRDETGQPSSVSSEESSVDETDEDVSDSTSVSDTECCSDSETENRVHNCNRHLQNLSEACMEFMEQLHGRPLEYDDEHVNDDGTEMGYLEVAILNCIKREQPHIKELKRNCASLKTSYDLVKNNIMLFCAKQGNLLSLGVYGSLLYVLLANNN